MLHIQHNSLNIQNVHISTLSTYSHVFIVVINGEAGGDVGSIVVETGVGELRVGGGLGGGAGVLFVVGGGDFLTGFFGAGDVYVGVFLLGAVSVVSVVSVA